PRIVGLPWQILGSATMYFPRSLALFTSSVVSGNLRIPSRRGQSWRPTEIHAAPESTAACLFRSFVHRLELVGRHRVRVTSVFLVEHQVIPAAVVGHTLLRLDATRFPSHLRPHRSDLHVRTGADLPIGALENFAIHRVDVTIVVDDPVAGLASLDGAPLLILEAGGVKGEFHGHNRLIGALHVLEPHVGSASGLFTAPRSCGFHFYPPVLRSCSSAAGRRPAGASRRSPSG